MTDKLTGNGEQETGQSMYDLIAELFPICRSITGDGVRDTLEIIRRQIPLQNVEIPTGTAAFDWEIPKEWNVRDAYIKNAAGDKIVDFKELNLHLLNYSLPVHKKVSLEELIQHLYTIPEKPDLVPYRTSYYQERWGFCMSQNQLDSLKNGEYEVYVDSSLENGHLTYGEYYIEGETEDEIIISTHVCHPSLCNDNLSGIAVATFLAKEISVTKPRYSYRFLFIPGTIGSIAWLSRNESHLHRIKHGLVITLLGDDSGFTYKYSRQGDAVIDRITGYYLNKWFKGDSKTIDFIPYGYDERQYCSPGINLPVGCLTRNPYGEFSEYHTSADNLLFMKPERLSESLRILREILEMVEKNDTYVNLNPKCEPQLGKRGLYDKLGGTSDSKNLQLAILWVLNLSDGKHDLLAIAEISNIDFHIICNAAKRLEESKLLRVVRE